MDKKPKPKKKKLVLASETIRALSDASLDKVVGGGAVMATNGAGHTCGLCHE